MTPDQLQALLDRMGCVRIGSTTYAPCPNHQPDETEPERFKLMVSPGASYPAVCFCPVCCIAKPTTDEDRQHNRAVSRRIWQSVGADLDTIFSRMETGDIRRLWASIRIGGQVVAQGEPDRASDQLLFMAYDSLLDSLDLNVRHRAWLRKRGLDPDWCFEIGYRSGTGPVASDWVVDGVPGLVDGEWKVRRDCLLVPCRDKDGLILSVKMRLFDKSRKKMRTLSSAGWGGPKGQAIIHYPLGVTLDTEPVWITEGERKADALYYHKRVNVVGLPGVNFAGRLSHSNFRSVILAFDMDDAGRDCTRRVATDLAGRGIVVQVASWDGVKGIDDACASGREIRVEEWEEGVGEALITSPPTKKSQRSTRLRDHEVLPYLKSAGPTLRSKLDCYQPLVSEYIRQGKIRMVKTPEGQLLEAV